MINELQQERGGGGGSGGGGGGGAGGGGGSSQSLQVGLAGPAETPSTSRITRWGFMRRRNCSRHSVPMRPLQVHL